MIIGKKHLVLAGLLIALGAAVYLNWQFAPTETLVDPSASKQDSYSSEGFVSVSADTESDETVQASTSASDAVDAAATKNFMEDTLQERQATRQEALDTLREIIDDASASSDQKEQAANTAARIAENMDKEASIELLIKAKGYKECVVVISDSQVNVVIPAPSGGLKSSDTAIIRDVVVGQMDISPASIKIIEAK